MSNVVAITGNRRTGKTHKAIAMAKQIGLPFIVAVPDRFLQEYHNLFEECAVISIEKDCRSLNLGVLVILEASHARRVDFERALLSAGTVIVEGNQPSLQSGDMASEWSWLSILELPYTKHIELKASRNMAQCCVAEGDYR